MHSAIGAFDSTLFFLVNGHHLTIADWFFMAVTQLGNAWVASPLLILILLRNVPLSRVLRVILCGTVALSLSGIINSQLKRAVGRQRPFVHFAQKQVIDTITGIRSPVQGNAGTREPCVRLLGPAYRNRSFPSGHTNTAFSAAMLLSLLLGGWWNLSFAAALLVGYSRVYLGVHYPLDVIAGGLLGALVTLAVVTACRFILSIHMQRKKHGT